MQLIAVPSGKMLILSVLVEVVDSDEGKEGHGLLDISGGSPSSWGGSFDQGSD